MQVRAMRGSVLAITLLGLAGLGSPRVSYGAPKVTSKAQATKSAAHYLGIQDPSKLRVSVETLVPKSDGTPFDRTWVRGRKCYLVKFTGVEVRVPWGEDGYRIAPVHGLNVFIAADSGRLLRVWSAEQLDAAARARHPGGRGTGREHGQ